MTISILSPKALQPTKELMEANKLMPISQFDYDKLKESIKKEGVKDPIEYFENSKGAYILDGFHRWTIAKELKLASVPVILISKKPKDLKIYAINKNLARRHLTTKQKHNLIDLLLSKEPNKSSRQVAKQVGISHNTVEKRRQETTGQIDQLKQKRIGIDGKLRSKPTKSIVTQEESVKYPKDYKMKAVTNAFTRTIEIFATLSNQELKEAFNQALNKRIK